MNPNKVDRAKVKTLTDLPNVGKATAADLLLLGINHPEQLVGQCAFTLYETLCAKTGHRHDPCVIDVFLSITAFMSGDPPCPWWEFTETRKQLLAKNSPRCD